VAAGVVEEDTVGEVVVVVHMAPDLATETEVVASRDLAVRTIHVIVLAVRERHM